MFVFSNFCSLKPESVKAKFAACIVLLNTQMWMAMALTSPQLSAVSRARTAIRWHWILAGCWGKQIFAPR